MTYRHATIVSCLALMLAFALPTSVNAVLKCPAGVDSAEVAKSWIALQLPIPSITITCTDDADTENKSDDVTKDYVKDLGAYIGGLYKYFVGVIGIIAAVMVFFGGLKWLTAGGNASRVKDAKDTIFAALIAILIAFGSYTLLYTINPKLVVLNPPVLKVADTFLVSFDNFCPTTKVCLRGTNLGNTCTADSSCPRTSADSSYNTDACGLPIELNGKQNLDCGVSFSYKKITSLKTTSDTCVGTYCPGGQVCTNTDNIRKSPTRGKGKCMTPEDRCKQINSAGDPPTDADCVAGDVAGVGACRIGDGLKFCVWLPLLTCPTGYDRASCGECVTAGKECPDVNSKTAVCSSDPILYQYNIDKKTNTFPAVCCKKVGDILCQSSNAR